MGVEMQRVGFEMDLVMDTFWNCEVFRIYVPLRGMEVVQSSAEQERLGLRI